MRRRREPRLLVLIALAGVGVARAERRGAKPSSRRASCRRSASAGSARARSRSPSRPTRSSTTTSSNVVVYRGAVQVDAGRREDHERHAHHHARARSRTAGADAGRRRRRAAGAARAGATRPRAGDRGRGQRPHRSGHALGGRAAAPSSTRRTARSCSREDPVLHDGPNEVAGDRVDRLPRRGSQRRRGRTQAREGRALSRHAKDSRQPAEPAQEARTRAPRAAAGRRAMNGAGAALLRAERLTKSFGGRRVVNDVSIEVRAGEVVGLLGPNGAGKTTTFHMIVGLQRPDGGRVLPERRGRHRAADVRARAARHRLPAAGAVGLPQAHRRGEHPRDPRDARPRRRTSAGSACATLLDELGIARLAKSKALLAVRRRAAAPGDHARARDLARRSCSSTSRSRASIRSPWLTFRAS